MNKSDLTEAIAYELILSKTDAKRAVDFIFSSITDALAAGEEV